MKVDKVTIRQGLILLKEVRLGYAIPAVDIAHRIDGNLPLFEQPFWCVVSILVVFTPGS